MLENILVRIVLLLIGGFIPALIYLVVLRNTEKFSREPWRMVLGVFSRGATLSIFIAIIFELILYFIYKVQIERIYIFLSEHPDLDALILACVIAPFVEELAKLYSVTKAKHQIDELEDGLIYGASAGLGFAAMENVLYELNFVFTGNLESFTILVFVRSISSTLLHASASGIAGYGLGCLYLRRTYGKAILCVLCAMGLHGLFNLCASISIIFGDIWYSSIIGFVFATAIAIVAFGYVREKTRTLDRQGMY